MDVYVDVFYVDVYMDAMWMCYMDVYVLASMWMCYMDVYVLASMWM